MPFEIVFEKLEYFLILSLIIILKVNCRYKEISTENFVDSLVYDRI